MSVRVAVSLAAVLVVALACSEDHVVGPTPAGVDDVATPGADSGVQIAVAADPFEAGQQVLRILVVPSELALGSYQGRVTFDPEQFELMDARVPDGGFRVVNTEPAAEGLIRFAGFTVDGFGETEVLALRFRTTRPIEPTEVTLELEVAGTLEGEAVPRPRLSVMRGAFLRVNRQEEQ